MEATIKVQVAGDIKEYPLDIAGFGDYLASGGKVIDLFEARRQGKEFFRTNRDSALEAVYFWVVMDDSSLAYRVKVNRAGNHRVMAAAPLPQRGPIAIRELYVA